MIASLLLAVCAASGIELGAGAGLGRILGDGQSALGRDPQTVDAVREPFSWGGWIGYEWMPGHILGMRYQAWSASGKVEGMDDLGGKVEESLDLSSWGFEYTRVLGRDPLRWRLGGGLGFAEATDVLQFEPEDLEAKGAGMAVWVRGGLRLPAGPLHVHLDAAGTWTSFSQMKPKGQDSYETSYPILQIEAALSYRI